LGGDEFDVFMPETERVGAWTVGDRIRQVVEENFKEGPCPVPEKPVTNKPVIYTLPC